MKVKGVNYDVGTYLEEEGESRPNFDPAIVHKELKIIKNDLHCNAVRISGQDIDRLMSTAKDALEQGLNVWLLPLYHNQTPEKALEYIEEAAKAAAPLQQKWPEMVFIVGSEFSLFTRGFLPGDTLYERMNNPKLIEIITAGTHNKSLNEFLTKAIGAIRRHFKGKLTYASFAGEQVDWSPFDFVGIDHYQVPFHKEMYVERLKPYFAFSKPVIVTEFGCCTYKGAEDMGGMAWDILDTSEVPARQLKGEYVRDEAIQAKEVKSMLDILEKEGVEGAFVFTFVSPALPYNKNPKYDLDMSSYSLVKSFVDRKGETYPDMPWEPKEAFKVVADYFKND